MESRTLLSYTFSLTGTTATATGDSSDDTLVITQASGLLYHSVDGSSPSDDWSDTTAGTQTLAASSSSTLNIVGGGGAETVNIGDTTDSGLADLVANINVTNPGGATALSIDDEADSADLDTLSSAPTFSATGGIGHLENLTYVVGDLSGLTFTTGTGTVATEVTFGAGTLAENPIPQTDAGFSLVGGSGTNGLGLSGGAFTDETYLPTGPGAGNIFLDSTNIIFSGLSPIDDLAVATNFTFTDITDSVNVVDGPIFTGTQSATIESGQTPADFEMVDFANKTNVTIDAAGNVPNGETLTLNNPTQAVGLASLTINTDAYPDFVNVLATPANVATSISLGSGNDLIDVTSAGLAAGPLFLDGGPGFDTLNVDSSNVTVNNATPGTITFGNGATISYVNFESVNITNAPITSIASTVVNAQEDLPFTGEFATFTSGDPTATASDFTATINFGDGTTGAGTITEDASGVFHVVGSHTYTTAGMFPAASVTVVSTGGSTATTTGGNFVTVAAAPLTPYPATLAAVDGQSFSSILGTFTAASPGTPASDFSAVINWGDGTTTAASAITESGQPNGEIYSVIGTHTYAQVGTLPITIQVFSSEGAEATIHSSVVIAAAALTATPGTVSGLAGTPLGYVPVVTFTDAGAAQPVTDYAATIDWGDGGPTANGVINVTGGVFTVAAAHTYASAGTFTGTVTITNGQGATTSSTFTSTGVAPSLNIASPTGVLGVPILPLTVATVTVPSGSPSIAIDEYTATIDWGDGTTPTSANLVTTPGSSVATIVPVSGHTYSSGTGTSGVQRTILVSLYDAQGVRVATASGPITLLLPTLTAQAITTSESTLLTNVALVGISTGTTTISPSVAPIGPFYSAVIDWGDGTSVTPATVSATGQAFVSGSHTYTKAGLFDATVTIGDTGTPSLESIVVPILVNAIPLPIAGILNPASDSGVSNDDAITKTVQPNFLGYTGPGASVTYVATPVGGGTALNLGTVTASASGFYSLTSNLPLPDGSYDIAAIAVDKNGQVTNTAQVLPGNGEGPLVIDTVGPKVTGLVFDRLGSQITVSYQDNLSGMDEAAVINGANYRLTSHLYGFTLTNLTTTPAATATGVETATLTYNGGTHKLPHAFFTFTITSGGIQDIAGNALDGEFYGYFPSGNNIPGGNFQAVIEAYHNLALAPVPTNGFATPVTPPGTPGQILVGSPSKGTAVTSTSKKVATKTVHAASVRQLAAHDEALATIKVAKKGHKA